MTRPTVHARRVLAQIGLRPPQHAERARAGSRVVALATLTAIAGCGGGGGGSGSAPAAALPPAPTVVVDPVAVKTIVLLPEPSEPAAPPTQVTTTADNRLPASTYPPGSANRVAFDLLNGERVRCGFGALQQNSALDAASVDSSGYFSLRAAEGFVSASTYFHVQDPAKSGFTGVQPRDRALARGYAGEFAADFAQDVIRASRPADPRSDAQLSAAQISDLLSTVYHLEGLMAPITEIGLDFRRTLSADGWDMSRTSIAGGYIRGVPAPGSVQLRSYPCQGATQINASFRPARETPNPAPDINDGTVGTPIYLEAPTGQTLRVASASLQRLDGGAAVALRLIDAANDIHAGTAKPRVAVNQAFLLPLVRLERGVAYRVQASGTRSSVAFSLDFSFTPSLE